MALQIPTGSISVFLHDSSHLLFTHNDNEEAQTGFKLRSQGRKCVCMGNSYSL